jgi:hypothetical protein
VGARGTDNFVPAPDKNPFRLSGVPSGFREIPVVTVPDTAAWAQDPDRAVVVADSATGTEVKPRGTADLGPVFYTND